MMKKNHNEELIIKIGQGGFSTVEQLYGEELFKVGLEGFSTVDQLYGGLRLPESRTPARDRRGKESPPRTIDCTQAAKKYGGLVMMDGKREFSSR